MSEEKIATLVKLQPKNGYLLVEARQKGEMAETKSGIVLPDDIDSDHQTSMARVIATCDVSEYKIGDIVLFSKLMPDDVMVEDKDGKRITCWFVREEDIKGLIK